MAAPLESAHQIARDFNLPAPSTIKVKNLRATIQGPSDAWGRPDRPQPVAVSAAVSLDAPFGASSATDTVAGDTVHYGLLSKAVLSVLYSPALPARSLRSLLDTIWSEMTGFDSRGQDVRASAQKQQQIQQPPFLHFAALRALEISVHLPKATLLGDGVSLTVTGGFEPAADSDAMVVKSLMRQSAVSLKIHGLRVPTLIGVNSNERLAKQVVVASVEIDRLEDDLDVYPELEQVVVQVMSDSSYETLEALGTRLTVAVAAHLHRKHTQPRDGAGWDINISLEKPVAVPLADAACVEMSTNTVNVPNEESTSL
ncbi:Dihydroneopterin aldolase [Cordyceps fumosorosea ARSEF 2679]|uniref:Dihydroneopterin aldolase n=1 Tax=Cordyceps fumosorosea (strain ARSEF 2679) TaxID=1081104 RepID=A0A168E0R2_CORFA|nr:Dihydroneopterin aldolase [Cordyceps fumosorosea ARSEF 2679]OAA73238.1 Dihydroneopterin aldolase [Cordyceps fumosorosea ARSEF 2679]